MRSVGKTHGRLSNENGQQRSAGSDAGGITNFSRLHNPISRA